MRGLLPILRDERRCKRGLNSLPRAGHVAYRCIGTPMRGAVSSETYVVTFRRYRNVLRRHLKTTEKRAFRTLSPLQNAAKLHAMNLSFASARTFFKGAPEIGIRVKMSRTYRCLKLKIRMFIR